MLDYDYQLILSISIRVIALFWSIVLIVRIRSWKMSLLSLMILLMSFQQGMRLFEIKSEVPGFIVSILVLLVVIFVGKLILKQKSDQMQLKEINENLEQIVNVRTSELEKTNYELNRSIAQIKTLSGMIPICCYCKQIRNDKESWQQLESYISEHSEAVFSHGICPECLKREISKLESDKENAGVNP
jgi:thioredoxin-related protein